MWVRFYWSCSTLGRSCCIGIKTTRIWLSRDCSDHEKRPERAKMLQFEGSVSMMFWDSIPFKLPHCNYLFHIKIPFKRAGTGSLFNDAYRSGVKVTARDMTDGERQFSLCIEESLVPRFPVLKIWSLKVWMLSFHEVEFVSLLGSYLNKQAFRFWGRWQLDTKDILAHLL